MAIVILCYFFVIVLFSIVLFMPLSPTHHPPQVPLVSSQAPTKQTAERFPIPREAIRTREATGTKEATVNERSDAPIQRPNTAHNPIACPPSNFMPDSHSTVRATSTTMIAGIAAGVVSTALVYPLDVIRTHQQASIAHSTVPKTAYQTFKHLLATPHTHLPHLRPNPLALYAGLSLPLAAQAIYKSTIFTTYTAVSKALRESGMRDEGTVAIGSGVVSGGEEKSERAQDVLYEQECDQANAHDRQRYFGESGLVGPYAPHSTPPFSNPPPSPPSPVQPSTRPSS